MFLILLALVSNVVTDEKQCKVDLQNNKLIRPKVSLANGARFISGSLSSSAEQCHQGCCANRDCDTSLHTAKNNSKGYNCFLFECHNHCTIIDSSYNDSVSSVSRSNEVNMPDIPVFVTPAPEVNTTEKTRNSVKVDPKPETITNKTTVTNTTAIIVNNTTVPVNPSNSSEIKTNNVTEEDDKPTPGKANSIKEHTEKPKVTQPDQTAKNDTASKETEVADPPKVTLPNEVPAKVKPTPKADDKKPDDKKPPTDNPITEAKQPPTDDKKPDSKESDKKEDTKEDKSSEADKEDKKEKDKSNDVGEQAHHDLKVDMKVDIHKTGAGGYTKNDLVFWLAVITGSSLIIFGLISVIRVYRNKRRRLYSSLTDDYLINGMYSI